MVRNRSASVGSDPEGVERNLNIPLVKSRGFTSSIAAAGPAPSPAGPWQPEQ
jgi:hypothetical protein